MSGVNISNPTGSVRVHNRTPAATAITAFGFPPNAPINFGQMVRPMRGLAPQSAEPASPLEGDVYLDDGTNTVSGHPGWRVYISSAWMDTGLQDIGDMDVDGGILA